MPRPSLAAVSDWRLSTYRNALLNLFWSLLGFAPVFVFCYQFVTKPWIYGFAAASFSVYAIPGRTLSCLQLSSRTRPYRSLRVHWLVRITQGRGTLTPSDHYPVQAAWFHDRVALEKIVRVTIARERFHLAVFIFFLLATGYAALDRRLGWSLLLCLSNLIYNIYPIWLQQYVRLRVGHCLSRFDR
jgi:hypothetical protein